MRYGKIMESEHLRVRDLNLPPDFWNSKEVWLCDQKLDSLDGCTDEVPGDFSCWGNQLVSLQHAPKTVGRDFDCTNNQLVSLQHAPVTIGRDFNCGDNQLTSLAGGPRTVGRKFACASNHLTSLAHAPSNVGGEFDCSDNYLTSLASCPKTVRFHFDCSSNHLTSLADIHTHIQKIDGVLSIGGNPITSHILGILLIQGCREVVSDSNKGENGKLLQQAVDILNRYMGRGRAGIMECQAEMLAAGLDDFAQI